MKLNNWYFYLIKNIFFKILLKIRYYINDFKNLLTLKFTILLDNPTALK